jgi:hypothetical protein
MLKYIDAIVSIDYNGFGARWNLHQSLRIAGDDAMLSLEDDVILCKNFTEKTRKIISENSNIVIQFFSMRRKDLTIGSRYEPGATYMMNQCVYFPPGFSKGLLDYYDYWDGRFIHKSGGDIFIASYMKIHKMRYFIHVPSLVQHRNIVSEIDKRRSRNRISLTFMDGAYE